MAFCTPTLRITVTTESHITFRKMFLCYEGRLCREWICNACRPSVHDHCHCRLPPPPSPPPPGPTDRLDTGTIKPNQQQQEVPKCTQARSISINHGNSRLVAGGHCLDWIWWLDADAGTCCRFYIRMYGPCGGDDNDVCWYHVTSPSYPCRCYDYC